MSIGDSSLFDARSVRRHALHSVMDLLKQRVAVNYLWKLSATLGLLVLLNATIIVTLKGKVVVQEAE